MSTLKLTFVNVGYGEAILLSLFEEGRQGKTFRMLIDGGSAIPEEYEGSSSGRIPLADYLEQHGISEIDLMVNTHIHEDHTCGLLTVAKQHRPAALWQTLRTDFYRTMPLLDEGEEETPTGRNYIRSINDYCSLCEIAGEGTRSVYAGMDVFLHRDLKVTILAPDAERVESLHRLMEGIRDAASPQERRKARVLADGRMNNLSLILMLEFAGRRILLPGDTNAKGFPVGADLSADIFKVGHHGQRDGVSTELLERIKPGFIVCCASSDRKYNSAPPEAVRMMAKSGAQLYFSDCPPLPEEFTPLVPHQALTFTITQDGRITAEYETKRGKLSP